MPMRPTTARHQRIPLDPPSFGRGKTSAAARGDLHPLAQEGGRRAAAGGCATAACGNLHPLPQEGGRRAAAGGCITTAHSQRGAALLVALILLVVITLVGLAAIGTTIIQNKAASNQYDRQIAFQSAEGAMRVAAAFALTDSAMIAQQCNTGGVVCQANPFSDPNLPAGSIHTVSKNPASGSTVTDTTFSASAVAAMQPQFVIQNMGQWVDSTSNVGCGNSANSHNYGVGCGSTQAQYYRITARSCDPSASACNSRAIVTLQSVIKQG